MNENEPLEFAKSSKRAAQRIDKEIDEIITQGFKKNPMLDVGDQALLEKLKKRSREAWMDYADSYAREERKYFSEKGSLKKIRDPYRDGIMKDPKEKDPYRDGIMKDPKIKDPFEKKYIIPDDKRRGNGISSNEPSENEKLMAEIKKYISELLELESQTEELKKILNAIKKQVEITDDETKGFYKL